MRRAVARGREQRPLEGLQHLGMEEKSFKRGQSSSTLRTDWDQSRVRDVVEERTSQAADPLWATRTPEQKQAVEAVAVDLGAPFIQTMAKPGPGADLVPDQFHVSQDLGAAVDKMRRAEPKALMAQGDATRKGPRQRGLYHPQNFSPEPAPAFCARQDLPLKVVRAWAAKELFAKFWADPSEGWARRFFPDGFGWVSRRHLQPVIEVARMRKRHPDHLLTYLRHPMTNAVTEGLNSKSQSVKAAARGFRSFRHYRIRILFFCGKLNLYPL